MGLWCCGSEAFVESVAELTIVRSYSADSALRSSDTLLVDLDEVGTVRPLDAVKAGTTAGCTVIVACRTQSMSQVPAAIRAGAHRALLKPLHAADVECASKGHSEADAPVSIDLAEWREKYAADILGDSPALVAALEMAMSASDVDCPVLITGESGTGKELLARALHRAGARSAGPCVPVNCPAIPRELVESELFGHTKGAFTGATLNRVGRFVAAEGGTLFLDEIGEMDLNIQSKLLRVLQDYQITPVGESRSQKVDVRIIAATNRDLEEMSTKGTFREDLYYRLNVVQIHLPSLRDRADDIPALVQNLLTSLAAKHHRSVPALSAAVMQALASYNWPGNIRQLRNVMERLVIMHRGGTIELKHLPECITRGGTAIESSSGSDSADDESPMSTELPLGGMDLHKALMRFEETMIRKALVATGGNKNQAAKILGLNRTTLVEKLRKRPLAAVG